MFRFKMQFMMVRILFLAAVLLGGVALGQSKSGDSIKRVAGNYKVVAIKNTDHHGFIIEFESQVKTGKYDALVLESDFVHAQIEVGSVLRLSAEILKDAEKGKTEVAQMLLFFPTKDSHVPVWLLSRKAPTKKLKGAHYLEMHAPTSDYLVL